MIKQPSPAEDCLILQSNPLQKKRSKVKKNSQKVFKKAKERAFESDAGKSLRSRKARQKNARGEGSSPLPPSKNKRDAGKASLRLGLLGSHARTHRAIGFEASKSSQNRHVFRLHGRFRHPTSLDRRGFTAHPAVYSSTYMFNRTPAAGSAARPGCVNGCVLVYLYVQPHTGRGFGRTSRLCKRLCTRLLIRSTAHRPRFGRTSAVRSTVHSPCVRPRFSCVSGCVFRPCVIRAFRCASRPCVIRAFRCAPNHTARPRNRPQLWQKVRSPGR